MASVMEEIDNRASESARYSVLVIGIVGALLGLLFFGLSVVLDKFMIEPIFCKADVSNCMSAISISGDISTIIVATIGILAMIGLKMARPLIVSLSSALSLWGLATMTSNMGWAEAAFWAVLLYTITYILFSWIARYLLLKPVLVAMLVIVIMARLAVI